VRGIVRGPVRGPRRVSLLKTLHGAGPDRCCRSGWRMRGERRLRRVAERRRLGWPRNRGDRLLHIRWKRDGAVALLRKRLRFRQVRVLAGRPRRRARGRRLGSQRPETVSRLAPRVPRGARQLLATGRMQWQRPLSKVERRCSRCELTGEVGIGRRGREPEVVEVQVRMR
jgi:hypothetical protein